MRRKHVLTVASILVAVSIICPAVRAMDIVKGGKAVAVVVCRQIEAKRNRRNPDDRMAAEALSAWVAKMTGATLEIVDAAPEGAPAIYVGQAAVAAGLSLDDIRSPSREGLRIRCDGRGPLLLSGQNGTSTVKAACRFLETLGCRYLIDGPLGEVYPRGADLSVGEIDITEKPGLRMRRIWGSSWNGMDLWKVWNGAGGTRFQAGHSWSGYVGVEQFKKHPEWFAMNAQGERYNNQWLCTSNPELRAYFADRVIEGIEKGAENPSISPPDGRGHCRCAACTALDDPKSIEVGGAVSKTNRYMDFYRAVALRVKKAHPEATLSFYAYADYTLPPTRGERLPDNVVAWIAPIRYCWFHGMGNPNCESLQTLHEVYEGWAKYVSKFGSRGYNYNFGDCALPFSKLSAWKHDIPYLADKGLVGIDMETLTCWMVYGPQIYLQLRLSYSPQADADALIDGYFTDLYGPDAGPLVRRYFMEIDQAIRDLRCDPEGGFRGLRPMELVYTPALLERLRSLIDQATEKAAGDARIAARVAMTEAGLKNAEQYMQIRQAMDAKAYTKAKDIYESMISRNENLLAKGLTNHYTIEYVNRFLARGEHLIYLAAMSPPNKVIQTLPDLWKHRWDKDGKGLSLHYEAADFDDADWETISTYKEKMTNSGEFNSTRAWRYRWFRTTFDVPKEHRRLLMFFSTLHPKALIYVNGKLVSSPDNRRSTDSGLSFTVDVTDTAHPGTNVIAIRRPNAWGWVFREPALLIDAPEE